MHEALIREKYKEPVDRKFEDAFVGILDGLQLSLSFRLDFVIIKIFCL